MPETGQDRASRLDYRVAGVDISAGNALVEAIRPLARATARPGSDSALGGFGALFDLKACGYDDPVLVAANDGVGTKLKIAIETGRHDSIGIDLVAMSVNDLVVQGAEPLFFLDYFATGILDVETARRVVAGIAAGCQAAGCALIGGETAEMPGMYRGGDYDLAGFAVGAVERTRILPRTDIAAGDVVLGLASSGLHSNGYSLVRRIVSEAGASYDGRAPFDPLKSLGEALLEPTIIYVKPLLRLLRESSEVKALAHITGGGLLENVPRVLPAGMAVEIDLARLVPPPVFGWLQREARLEEREMLRTFNCGIGMVAVVAPGAVGPTIEALERDGILVREIGHACRRESGSEAVLLRNRLKF